ALTYRASKLPFHAPASAIRERQFRPHVEFAFLNHYLAAGPSLVEHATASNRISPTAAVATQLPAKWSVRFP
ncbi:MAG: hypothetical protein AB7P20_28475, partial [Rhizobiaceae bacterium]